MEREMGEKAKYTLFTSSLVLFTLTIGVGIISPILPIIAKNMGAGGVVIGLIFSAFSISRLVFLPMFGRLSDRYGRRPLITAGLSLYTLLALLYALARNPEELIVIRLFHGMSSAMVMPVILAMIAQIAPEGKEGKYMGFANRSIFLGMSFGPLIGGVLSDFHSEKMAFFAMALMSLITLIIAILTLPEIKPQQKSENGGKEFSRRIISVLIFRILNSIGRGSMMSFLPIYGYLIGLSYTEIGMLVFTNLFVSGIIQPYGGAFSDRRGFIFPVMLSTILSAVIYVSIIRYTTFHILLVLSAFLGISSSLSLPAVSGLVAVEGKKTGNLGGLMGYFSASKSLGRAIGPMLAGVFYDLGGQGLSGIAAVFTASAIATVIAGMLFWAGVRESHQVIEMD
ncbi:MFS transporter [Geoglobus acetivorans]|uniref:Major facilitator superfamily MFS_1 n=1 Tax=Geoglobus acetivorans TaxID=565033 RepID=A0A0A7GJL0_GEOAI|nr:major facilitator superfamily MFS_1 [Geoglobus acetivorans]